jgi:hypothetical protein
MYQQDPRRVVDDTDDDVLRHVAKYAPGKCVHFIEVFAHFFHSC